MPQLQGGGLEREKLNGAGAEGVAALGGEEGGGGAEDAHFEGHAGRTCGGGCVDGEDGIPEVTADEIEGGEAGLRWFGEELGWRVSGGLRWY